MSPLAHFKDDEVKGLDLALCAKLDVARTKAGVPFIITSGKRTIKQNLNIRGAVCGSAHLIGKAVDLKVDGAHAFNRIICGLVEAGLGSRMGFYFMGNGRTTPSLYPTHIHVDNDATKPQHTTWAAMEQNG